MKNKVVCESGKSRGSIFIVDLSFLKDGVLADEIEVNGEKASISQRIADGSKFYIGERGTTYCWRRNQF